MTNRSPIIEYNYTGVLAEHCKNFIAEKRGVGFNYNSEAKKLCEFSGFSKNYDISADTLPTEVVEAWISKRPMDSERNRYARFTVIRQFADYMQRMGFSAYYPTNDEVPRYRANYLPHIFAHEEIACFFKAADAMEKPRYTAAPRRHFIMPMIFKLLYCCGLRVSEALSLVGADVDLENGILFINKSKNDQSRYVPMSTEIHRACIAYDNTRLKQLEHDWFFAAPDGGKYHDHAVYMAFREILAKAGISHGGRGKGPRVHDFRHSFAVHCLQKWVSEGKDLTNAIPRLSAFLGHNGFSSTEQYLRMTAEVYPEITKTLHEKYGDLIPEVTAR